MEPSRIRQPKSEELARIGDVLRRLREHFYQWSGYEGHEHDLIGFAYYEGCGGTEHCGAILAEAAPIALGNELVQFYGFRWAVVRHGKEWHIAVMHQSSAEPIDLLTLEDGRYDNDAYDEPPDAGEVTYQSLEGILSSVGLSRRWTY